MLRRELFIGLMNGVLWALVSALLASWWFNDILIGVALAIGLLINITIGAWFGMAVPLLLKRFNVDPAISGAVILTTITDIVGFVSFLGAGTVIVLGGR